MRAHFHSYFCPKGLNPNFVSGGEYADVHIYTSLTITKCVETNPPTGKCEDSTVIDAKIDNLELKFLYLDTNFDGTNIETPLVGYVNYSLQDTLAS